MRGFGSIHFPDGYFFASTLRFIIHISDQSHYYNQQNKAWSDPDWITETIYTLVYILYHTVYRTEMQGYIRKCLIGKLVQTFQIFIIRLFQTDIKYMIGILRSYQDNRCLSWKEAIVADIPEDTDNRTLYIIQFLSYRPICPFHQTYQLFIHQ